MLCVLLNCRQTGTPLVPLSIRICPHFAVPWGADHPSYIIKTLSHVMRQNPPSIVHWIVVRQARDGDSHCERGAILPSNRKAKAHTHVTLMHFIKPWFSLGRLPSDPGLVVVSKRHTVSTHSLPVVTHTIVCNATPLQAKRLDK